MLTLVTPFLTPHYSLENYVCKIIMSTVHHSLATPKHLTLLSMVTLSPQLWCSPLFSYLILLSAF